MNTSQFRSQTHPVAGVRSSPPAGHLQHRLHPRAAKTVLRGTSIRALRQGVLLPGRGRQPTCRVGAVAASETFKVYEKRLQISKGSKVKVLVEQSDSGDQQALVETELAGKLILHWGVEGGANYEGGWRLPGGPCRPEGTVEYKKRALQTPFRTEGGVQRVRISLNDEEASDYLNFVIKDTSADIWYDQKGTNFHIPLNGNVATMSIDEQIPDAELPELPGDLCGIWSFIKWELAGCPNRSQEESHHEFQQAIEELRELQRDGHSLDELWEVARGQPRYQDFMSNKQPLRSNGKPAATLQLPEDLVGLQAYLLWEQAGKPDGANFSTDARSTLKKQLQQGKTVEDLERILKGPPGQPAKQVEQTQEGPRQEQAQPRQEQAQPRQEQAPPPSHTADVGASIKAPSRNPLDMIKRGVPLLSQPKQRQQQRPLSPLIDAAGRDESCVWYRSYNMGNKTNLLVAVRQPEGKDGPTRISLTTDHPTAMVLHWGVRRGTRSEWLLAPDDILPEGSVAAGNIAFDTPFQPSSGADAMVELEGDKVQLQQAAIVVPAGHDLTGLIFVCKSQDDTMWWRDGGSNFTCPIPGSMSADAPGDVLAQFEDVLSRTIVDCEVNSDQWTLMHRYNKAAELLDMILNDGVEDVTAAMATVFVWLRYSSARHLTWQRNYNTQPRILGEAQARLTNKIAEAHGKTGGEAQEWVRSMLSCVGRGGNAQAIRDEILNIMHRNNIGEKRGTWMEDWHQKLHNNTTPDDVAICEAYITFLERDGDNGAYWRVLTDAGITRERLEGFDRPIKVEPQHYPDKKDALIGEFRNYLKILRAVHSGADLQASAEAAGGSLPGNAKGYLGYVLTHQFDSQLLPLIENAVEARTEISQACSGHRELLYLDLALESVVRGAAERGSGAAGTGASALIAPLLQNLVLSAGDNEELAYCLKAWQGLPAKVQQGSYPAKDEALKAAAVIDRIRRAIAATSDSVSQRIDPISSAMGRAFGVDSWAVDLFAEEVVRGGPAFAVSLVLSAIEPGFRSAAELGAWQLISPVDATGRVVVVSGLHEVQDETYEEPTVLLAKRVTGEEEVPEGAVAVLTPDAPDVLSHVSVRARNMKVLFAICHEQEPLGEIEKLAGQTIALQTSAAGGVSWEVVEAAADAGSGASQPPRAARQKLQVKVPKWCGQYIVGMDGYKDGVVGAKSKNLAGLRGKLPPAINLPPSVTVPFGTFEEIMGMSENASLLQELDAAVKNIPEERAEEALSKCREIVMQVQLPEQFKHVVCKAMEAAAIPVPKTEERWEQAAHALKSVWASKYNERAFLSMKKVGLNFLDLRMAVLVQRVVPAAYAFVIHTENPTNGKNDEIFAELVIGLGESIVSGMVPGSSLSFVANKGNLDKPEIVMFPSKGDGMFVCESLIFRSDSNGEDLEGYAGAGLYDSVTMDPTVVKKVDYNSDRLITDSQFCLDLMQHVCKAGMAIEEALGSAQDIEGAVEENGAITVVQTRPQM